jgi:hypothetical protein
MAEPAINTAIPKARYRYGEYVITFLGEVDSKDNNDYQFIAAVAREEDPTPGLFLTCEKLPMEQREPGGTYQIRAMMKDGEQVLASSDHWKQFSQFETDVLDIVKQMLSLSDEQPFKLS